MWTTTIRNTIFRNNVTTSGGGTYLILVTSPLEDEVNYFATINIEG